MEALAHRVAELEHCQVIVDERVLGLSRRLQSIDEELGELRRQGTRQMALIITLTTAAQQVAAYLLGG